MGKKLKIGAKYKRNPERKKPNWQAYQIVQVRKPHEIARFGLTDGGNEEVHVLSRGGKNSYVAFYRGEKRQRRTEAGLTIAR